MTKQQFFAELRENLKGISESSISEIMSDYEEHFEVGKEKGKSEAEVCDKLGDPKSIAKEFKTETLIKTAEVTKTPTNISRAVFSTIGLSLFNLIFVVGPFVGIAAALFALLVSGAVMILSGVFAALVVIVSPVFQFAQINTNPAAGLLISIGTAFFGVFFTLLSFYLNKYFYILTLKYLKFNLSIINNKEK